MTTKFFALAVLACLALVPHVSASCATIDEVTLQLRWVLQGQFGGYIAANEGGFYADECLRVLIKVSGPRMNALLLHFTSQIGVEIQTHVLVR
jgi:NitT/TauT family transport system substrate-binding protein